MILSGLEIAARMGKEIGIDPYDPAQLNPNSYNLRLHNELLVYDAPCTGYETGKQGIKSNYPCHRFTIRPWAALPGPHTRTIPAPIRWYRCSKAGVALVDWVCLCM